MAGRLPRVDVPVHGHEPRAPRFALWCVSGITAMLAHGGQGIHRNSERFSVRAVLAVGWLEHILRSSQLGIHLQPAIVWRDVKQGCVATPRQVACMHEPVQLRDTAHPRGG